MAKWSEVAIGLVTLVTGAVDLVRRFMTPGVTRGLTMLVSNVGIGGVIDLVFG